MSDEIERAEPIEQAIVPLSHSRILVIMAVIGLAGSIAGFIFVSTGFGLGIFIGTLLGLLNYFWLKVSIKKIFDRAIESGERPRLLGLRYFARYIVLAIVVAVIYMTGLVSVLGVILGMGGFGFAVVIEGILKIFTNTVSKKEV